MLDNIIIAIIGYTVVFTVLLFLFLIFKNLPKFLKYYTKLRKVKETIVHKINKDKNEDEIEMTGEVSAVISATIHLYTNEIHDEEHTTLTIKKVSRVYSPWSSKIYGVKQFTK